MADADAPATTPSSPESDAPSGVQRVSFPTAVRTITEYVKNYPSYLRHIFQSSTGQLEHRLPWMTEYHPEHAHALGDIEDGQVALFDCSTINTSLVGEDHETCCIDMYFYERFIASKGVEDQRSSPEEHLRAWKRFVRKYNADAIGWLRRLRLNEEAFFRENTAPAIMIKIHCICAANEWSCAVDAKHRCPMCYTSAAKLSADSPDRPDALIDAISLLDAIMRVDMEYLAEQISELKQHNRKRDLRLFKLEQAAQPPSQKHKP